MDNFKYYKPLILFLVVAAISGGAYFIVKWQYYPIAFVGSEPILSRDYEATFIAMNNFVKVRSVPLVIKNSLDSESFNDPSFNENLKRLVLTEMIKNRIISHGIEKLAISDLKKKVNAKINESLASQDNNSDFLEGIGILYGLELNRFKKLILEPFAQKEVAIEEKKVDNLNEWYGQLKGKAKVYIFFKNMKWDKERGEVVADYKKRD